MFKFHCETAASDRISLIKETATCQYLMVISTPRLCHDVAFLPPQQELPHQVACTRVLPAAAIPSWLAEKAEKDEQAELQADKMLDNIMHVLDTGEMKLTDEELAQVLPAVGVADQIMIGDIIVGGHNVVPKGKTIQKSAVLGGKEKLIATIAKSNGFLATEEELQKIDIKNARKEIEDVKKELEKVAGDKAWRLDVIETPRGRELRGIIDDDDDRPNGDANKPKADMGDGQAQAAPAAGETQVPKQDGPAGEDVEEQQGENDDFEPQEEGSEEVYKDEL